MNARDNAKALLQLAQQRGARATVVGTGVLAALVILWYSTLEPTVAEARRTIGQVVRAESALRAIDAATTGDESGARARHQALQRQAADSGRELKHISFELPGFPRFDVPAPAAPVVWLAAIAFLVTYLSDPPHHRAGHGQGPALPQGVAHRW